MTDPQATIVTKASKFRNLITLSALSEPGGDPPWVHSDVYLDIDEDSVDVLISAGGGSILTYNTFEPAYFEELEGSAIAFLSVSPTLERLNVATDGGRTEFRFTGPQEGDLAEGLEADGALSMRVSLPANEKALENVPEELPLRWDENGCFLSPSGNPHQTYVDTTVEQVQTIIDAVEVGDGVEYFPVAVEEGEFTLDVGDDMEYLRGGLSASNVEGPDYRNWYGPGFEAVFGSTLSGDVELQTTPGENGGHPLAVRQEDDEKTIRHVLVKVNPA